MSLPKNYVRKSQMRPIEEDVPLSTTAMERLTASNADAQPNPQTNCAARFRWLYIIRDYFFIFLYVIMIHRRGSFAGSMDVQVVYNRNLAHP